MRHADGVVRAEAPRAQQSQAKKPNLLSYANLNYANPYRLSTSACNTGKTGGKGYTGLDQ